MAGTTKLTPDQVRSEANNITNHMDGIVSSYSQLYSAVEELVHSGFVGPAGTAALGKAGDLRASSGKVTALASETASKLQRFANHNDDLQREKANAMHSLQA